MPNSSSHIQLSNHESEVFNLKTGRYHADRIDADVFKKDLATHRFDLLNVRIRKAEDISMLSELSDYVLEKMIEIQNFEMKFPLYYHQSLIHQEIEFVAAKYTDSLILEMLIDESMKEEPIGYFKTSLLEERISAAQELQVLKKYYAQYLKEKDPSKVIWFLKFQDQFCAFVVHDFDANAKTLNCPLSGILPSFRQLGIFSDIGRFTFRTSEALGAIRFITGARANNHASIKAFEKELLQQYAADEVYILLHKKWVRPS